MGREILIKKTVENLNRLSDQKLQEVSDFTEFLITKIDSNLMTEGIQKLTTDATAFQFLHEEEELYSKDDLKEQYK